MTCPDGCCPKEVLDLFCGAGGAAMGLHRAWPHAHIVGVDIKPQKHYPFEFILGDAMTHTLDGYDFIWASPPCQRYTALGSVFDTSKYADLLEPVRQRFLGHPVPWIIENVERAPLAYSITLCGAQFGLRVYRHRRFESNFLLMGPPHEPHRIRASATRETTKRAWSEGRFLTVCGDGGNSGPYARMAMGIPVDAMTNRATGEAIPPAYAEYLARQFQFS